MMELNCCAKGGIVIKVQNDGRPALVSKTLLEVYESEDAKKVGRPASSTFAHADDDLDSDFDDATTLKHLKEGDLTKKRKFSDIGENSKQVYEDENPVPDEFDLNEPLLYWKWEKPNNLKAKRKGMNQSVGSSSLTLFDIKSEQNLISESYLEVGAEFGPANCVKVEVQEVEELGCLNQTSSPYDLSDGLNEGPNLAVVVFNEFQKMVEPIFSAEEHQYFLANEISYDHLGYVEPISIVVPWDGVSIELDTPKLICAKYLDFPPLALEMSEEITEDCSCLNYSIMEGLSEQSNNFGLEIYDNSIGCTEVDLTHEQDCSLISSDKNCGSSQESINSLKMADSLVFINDTIVDDEEQTLSSKFDDVKMNVSNGADIVINNMDDELLKSKEKQTKSCLKAKTFDSADALSSPEPCQPIGRVFSKLKIISPCSQEPLRLAMNSAEVCNDVDQHNEANITASHGGPQQFRGVSQRNFITSPGHTKKKSQNAKGNREGPRFARTRLNLNTGCISNIQGCSESAIAFSQKQLHNMKTLAVKLINELNSMKDFVKEKSLSEAYRRGSLKNDIDKVKSAVQNATKVEETAQKWLTMMSRDCNRFCKIMELTPKGVVGTKEAVVKEEKKKKIMFADEAGGELCHVKLC